MDIEIKESQVIEYKDEYWNVWNTMVIRSLMEEVPKIHAVQEMKSLAKMIENTVELSYDSTKSKIWLLELKSSKNAIMEKSIVGYLACRPSKNDINEIYINGLYIDPIFRRKGFAKKLGLELLAFCQENQISKMKAEIATYFENIMQIFKQKGFSVDSENIEDGIHILSVSKIISHSGPGKTIMPNLSQQ